MHVHCLYRIALLMLLVATLLPAALSYSIRSSVPSQGRQVAAVSRTPAVALLAGRWPWERPAETPPSSDDEAGKFVRHTELQPGCAPLGMLAAGLGEEQLETLACAAATRTIAYLYTFTVGLVDDAAREPISRVPTPISLRERERERGDSLPRPSVVARVPTPSRLRARRATVESVVMGPDGPSAQIPILVLSQADLRMELRDVLSQLVAVKSSDGSEPHPREAHSRSLL